MSGPYLVVSTSHTMDILGDDDKSARGMCVGQSKLLLELVWQPLIVIIEKRNIAPACVPYADITSLCPAHRVFQNDQAKVATSYYSDGVYRALVTPIKDDDDLKALTGLLKCAENGASEQTWPVFGRDHYTDIRALVHCNSPICAARSLRTRPLVPGEQTHER
jgi:hypothetical protein